MILRVERKFFNKKHISRTRAIDLREKGKLMFFSLYALTLSKNYKVILSGIFNKIENKKILRK